MNQCNGKCNGNSLNLPATSLYRPGDIVFNSLVPYKSKYIKFFKKGIVEEVIQQGCYVIPCMNTQFIRYWNTNTIKLVARPIF